MLAVIGASLSVVAHAASRRLVRVGRAKLITAGLVGSLAVGMP